jgi:HAMP domain-containing protein/type II secretory pathway pseudopilin PulG
VGLKAKFNLVMIIAFGAGLVIAAGVAYRIAQHNARREVLEQAQIMMEAATDVRHYTVQTIVPLLQQQLKTEFLRPSIPSWAAQNTFSDLKNRFPDYNYKEATLNPTNPSDRAVDWEKDIISAFSADPKARVLIGEHPTATGEVLTLSRPFRLTDPSCLQCHSTPDKAPATMIALYGKDNGFGWKLGSVIGAQIVSVPMQVAFDLANRNFLILLAGLGLAFLVMIVLLNVMLHIFIVKPVKTISHMAGEVSMGNMDVPEYAASGKDEIASLATSFNRMRRSLENAMKLLEAE